MTALMDEKILLARFAQRLRKDVPLANLTTAKVGGAARYFLSAESPAQLAEDVSFLWANDFPFFILGSGSNILVSDAGIEGVVIHNKARLIHFDENGESHSICAESGAILITVARQAALRALPVWSGQPPFPAQSAERFMATPAPMALQCSRTCFW